MTFVQRGTLALLLSKRADVTVAEALQELQVPLGQLPINVDPEDWFVIGQRLLHGGDNVAPGAPNFAGVAVSVGAAATVGTALVVIEHSIGGNSVAGNITWRKGAVAGSNLVSSGTTAERDGGPSTIPLVGIGDVMRLANPALPNFLISGAGLAAGTPLALPYPIILTNGEFFGIFGAVINTQIFGHFAWREFLLKAR